MMQERRVLDQAVRHSIEETWAVFTPETGTPDPALFLARLSDLARSNAFLFPTPWPQPCWRQTG